MALNQQGMHALIRGGIVKSLLTIVVMIQLVACGGGGTSGSDSGTMPSSAATSGTSTSSSSDQSSASATGSLSLSWVAPAARADGTPLSLADIDGYRIYYGTSAGSYPNQLDLTDATAQAATITDLPAGTYYLVMTTYDVSGLESAYSSMATKNVQ
jgi:hypothetical protein